jgi:hypothetical protein
MDGRELGLSLGHHCCLFLGSRTSNTSAGLKNGFMEPSFLLVSWFRARLEPDQQGSHWKKCWGDHRGLHSAWGRGPTGTPAHNGIDGLQRHLKPGDMPSLVLGELILIWIVGSWSYHWATTVACFWFQK